MFCVGRHYFTHFLLILMPGLLTFPLRAITVVTVWLDCKLVRFTGMTECASGQLSLGPFSPQVIDMDTRYRCRLKLGFYWMIDTNNRLGCSAICIVISRFCHSDYCHFDKWTTMHDIRIRTVLWRLVIIVVLSFMGMCLYVALLGT